MKYDTAGNIIQEPIHNCDCGLTGGCEKCNPFYPFHFYPLMVLFRKDLQIRYMAENIKYIKI